MLEEKEVTIIYRTNSETSLLKNDILHVFFSPDITIEAQDFIEGRDVYLELGEGRKLRHLIEFGEFCSATNEARTWAEQNSPHAIAEALVIKGLSQRILAKFYLAVRKNNHPCKVFGTLETAKAWLNTF